MTGPPVFRTVSRPGALVALALLVAGGGHAAARQEQLIERTVAIVGGAVITLSDVRTALALGLVEASSPAALGEGVTRLVERELMLHEVERFAPPEPAQAEMDGRLAAITARAGSADALAATLREGGFGPARLAQWVRDDLRIAAYLAQRFAVAGVPTDAEVADYLREHRDELSRRGVADADAPGVARERLLAERRARLVADWLADLRRRTDVVEFGVP